jgi:hypothetical protein
VKGTESQFSWMARNGARRSGRQMLTCVAGSTMISSADSGVLTKLGRNDPCPCDSGKKYKRCCGGDNEMSGCAKTPLEISQNPFVGKTLRPCESAQKEGGQKC